MILHCGLLSHRELPASLVKMGMDKLHGDRVFGLAGGAAAYAALYMNIFDDAVMLVHIELHCIGAASPKL